MNKWQIICPLVAMAMVGVVFAIVSGSNHHRYYVHAQSRTIGEELVATTNSARLVHIGSGLQKRLSEFLVSPAGVAEVLLGDEPSPVPPRLLHDGLSREAFAGQTKRMEPSGTDVFPRAQSLLPTAHPHVRAICERSEPVRSPRGTIRE